MAHVACMLMIILWMFLELALFMEVLSHCRYFGGFNDIVSAKCFITCYVFNNMIEALTVY